MNQIFNSQISWYWNAKDTTNRNTISIHDALYYIYNGASHEIVDRITQIRSIQDQNQRNALKIQLPTIMWQGVFSERRDIGFESPSSVFCIDIDHMAPQEIDALRNNFANIPWIMAFFISPSGDGLKVLVKTDCYDKAIMYVNCYLQLIRLFKDCFGVEVDESCKSVSKACFMSYDPQLYVNWDVTDWHFDYDLQLDSATSNPVSATSSFYPAPPSKPQMFMNRLNTQLNGLSDERIMDILDRKFHKYPKNYQEGNRANSVYEQAKKICMAGIPMETALTYLEENFLPAGLPSDEIARHTTRAYSQAQFGSERGNYLSYRQYKKKPSY